MNAVTETAEITTETTAFQRSVLRAMLELAGSNTSNEIARLAGFKPEPVRVCLARLRDAGLIGTEVNPDKGGPPLWHLRASVDTVRSMVAAPIPSANDGTPGDGAPDEDHEDEETAACAEPDDFRDGDDRPTVADDAYGLDYDPRVAEAEAVAYDALVEAESAADEAPLAGEDVCGADAVIAEWKREHAPAAPAIAPADHFAVWLADTHAGCAGQRAIDAAEQEAARLRAEAAEMVREAAETRQRGLIVAEIIRFADQRNVSTSTADADFGLRELLAAAYEAVSGKRVA